MANQTHIRAVRYLCDICQLNDSVLSMKKGEKRKGDGSRSILEFVKRTVENVPDSQPGPSSLQPGPCRPTSTSSVTIINKTSVNITTTALSPSEKRSRYVKFVEGWLQDDQFKDWLRHDTLTNKMYCCYCREAGLRGVWAETGTDNFKKKTVLTHFQSEGHIHAACRHDTTQPKLADVKKKMSDQEKASYTAALKSVYWLAVEELPNSKHKSLLNLQSLQGCHDIQQLKRGGNSKKDSPWSHNQLLAALNQVMVNKLLMELRKSPYVGVGLDESTDRSAEKHVVFVVRFLKGDVVSTTYLKIAKISNGTAQTIYDTLKETFDQYCIPIDKMFALGVDGANVMLSERNGVVGLHKKQNPFSLGMHCVNHRLHLAVKKAAHGIGMVDALQKLVATIYQHINNSPNRLAKFQTMAALLSLVDDKDGDGDRDNDANQRGPAYRFLRFKKVFEIRWLSLGDAVKAVIHNYQPLMILLEEEAAENDPTAQGLLRQLKQYRVVAMLHVVMDVLSVTNHLSRIFQYRDLSFMSIKSQISNVLDELDALHVVDGIFTSEFAQYCNSSSGHQLYNVQLNIQAGRGEQRDQVGQFSLDKVAFIGAVHQQIKGRFPHVELLDAMQIFEPGAYPDDPASLASWGRQHLGILLEHYGTPKENDCGVTTAAVVNSQEAQQEFPMFKRMVVQHRGEDRDGEFHLFRSEEIFPVIFGGARKANRNIYKEMYKLMLLALLTMPSNNEAERSFSVQNRVKSRARCRLSIERLDQLMRIAYGRIPLEQFPFEEALAIYREQPHRWY